MWPLCQVRISFFKCLSHPSLELRNSFKNCLFRVNCIVNFSFLFLSASINLDLKMEADEKGGW